MEPKKYGLIRLNKADASKAQPKISKIFESDSDDDSNSGPKSLGTSSGIKRQTQLDITRALTDDPTVFEYDSIYDEIKSQKQSKEEIGCEHKEKQRPKYINNLLKFSENRKKENERRIERKIQKEREAEGNQFADKEEFVTNAYKEKLEEIKVAEERDRKEEAIEDMLDVRKQNDLSGFYRHLLNRETDKAKPSSESKTSDVTAEEERVKTSFPKSKNKKNIRERKSSSDSSSERSPQKVQKSVETKDVLVKVERKTERIEAPTQHESRRRRKESADEGKSEKSRCDRLNDTTDSLAKQVVEEEIGEPHAPKEPVDQQNSQSNSTQKLDKRELLLKIFTKRTVDQVFTDAQMRYYQRRESQVI